MSDPTIATVPELPVQRDAIYDEHWRLEAIEAGRKSLAERVPAHYRDAVVTVPAVQAWVRELVAHARDGARVSAAITRGRSLLLVGPTGTGKTWEAYGAVRALAVSGAWVSWRFLSAADLYARMRPRPGVDAESEFEAHARAGLLVLDDLGAAKSSEWTEEINYRLINHRYENELPTLITSNVPPKQLAEKLGDRVASRLVEMAERVVLSGPDRRRVS